MGELEGRVAIVTGAGRGVGRAEALALAAEGAAVVVNDLGGAADGTSGDPGPARAVADEIVGGGGRATADVGSVSDPTTAARLVDMAVGEFGRLDIVVNNAGILRDRMSFNLTDEDFDAVLKVHLYAHFYLARAAGAHWRARSKAGEPTSGRIVNTTSESGLYANAGQINYAAAKAGIAAMTVVLARELGRFNVTANAIAPRAATRLLGTVREDAASGDGGPLDPANVAPFVTFLCTDAAAHITGQVFTVWGGRVQRVQGWTPAEHIDTQGRWTVASLRAAAPGLFPYGESGVPPFYPVTELSGATS